MTPATLSPAIAMSPSLSSQAGRILILAQELEANSTDHNLRHELLAAIAALSRSVQKPSHSHYQDWADLTRMKSTAALLNHNVIQSIPAKGFISARRLAALTSLDESIVIRLMRHLTSQGIIALRPGAVCGYGHTHLSQAWLQKGGPQYTLMMLNLVCTPDIGKYLRTHDAAGLEDPTHSPSVWQANAEGKNYWEVLSQEPEKLSMFDEAMQFAEDMNPLFGAYPFDQLVNPNYSSEKPLIVDVGGGRGQVLLALKNALPGLKGCLICQDRPEVLAAVNRTDLKDVELMPHDFFTPQPVKNSLVYYLRRITHDWDDASVLKILKQLVPAMSRDSRVLIHDLLLPERAVPGTDLTAYWMDYAVMMCGGRERTEHDIITLLDKAGLQHLKTWPHEVSAYAVIEAKVKSA